jgi:hypothetical protein
VYIGNYDRMLSVFILAKVDHHSLHGCEAAHGFNRQSTIQNKIAMKLGDEFDKKE